MGGKMKGGRGCTRDEGWRIGCDVLAQMRDCGAIEKGAVAGSVRRHKENVGDVDLVVIPGKHFDPFMNAQFGTLKNGKPAKNKLVDGVQVDVLVTTEDGWGAAMMHFTGPASLNVRQRAVAKRKGLKLNEKGLWRDDELVAGKTEEEVYTALEQKYLLPEERK